MPQEPEQPRCTRRKVITLGAGCLLFGHKLAQSHAKGLKLKKVRRVSRALGTEVALTVLHPNAAQAETAIAAAFSELDEIENVMSLYRPHSQICQLNRTGSLRSPDMRLLTVLNCAHRISALTEGAFDITVQPLWEAFHQASLEKRYPGDAEILAIRKRVGWRKVVISPGTVSLEGEGTAITLNGIAQGFAADRVAALFARAGIEHALIDCGEIHALGTTERDAPWKVGIQHPRDESAYVSIAGLSGRCLATSGDYATRFDGTFRSNHLFDPGTGRSPKQLASVSVAAPTAMEADALSTAISIAGVERGEKLMKGLPGVDAMLVLKSGRTLRTEEFPC